MHVYLYVLEAEIHLKALLVVDRQVNGICRRLLPDNIGVSVVEKVISPRLEVRIGESRTSRSIPSIRIVGIPRPPR